MPSRGDVYRPNTKLPPGSPDHHYCVVLSEPPSAHNDVYAVVAIIRGTMHRNGTKVYFVPFHSFMMTPAEFKWLKKESILETHQIFSLPVSEFQYLTPVGTLPPDFLKKVLVATQRLFA